MEIILLSDAEGDTSDYLTQNNAVAEQLSHWSTCRSTQQPAMTFWISVISILVDGTMTEATASNKAESRERN
jgi:hypothetical protein